MSWFNHARSYFAKMCVDKRLYYTLCLLGASDLTIDGNLPALAAMNTDKKVNILFHPDTEQIFLQNPDAFCFLAFHEVRHIIQGGTHPSLLQLPDLTPLVKRGQEMEQQAETQEAKDLWRKWTEQLSDREHPITKQLLNTAINIGMDATVNRDAIELWGKEQFDFIDSFLKQKDEKSKGAISIEKLSLLLQTELSPNAEWVYYTNEYLKHMAKDINDPNDTPKEVFCSMDSHAEKGEESDAAAHKVCQDACSRAQEESKLMAHKAGKEAGDAKFMTDVVKIDNSMKKLVDTFKFKVKTILMPSPEELYNYNVFNRLWQTHDLPGSINIEKAKPAVALVIDTSGSCWRTDWLNQMVAVGRYLLKQKKLASMWTFDTALTPITINSGPISLTGGGGTVWQRAWNDDILAAHKKRKVDIVLISDMEIYNIEALTGDSRVIFHPIDLTKLLLK